MKLFTHLHLHLEWSFKNEILIIPLSRLKPLMTSTSFSIKTKILTKTLLNWPLLAPRAALPDLLAFCSSSSWHHCLSTWLNSTHPSRQLKCFLPCPGSPLRLGATPLLEAPLTPCSSSFIHVTAFVLPSWFFQLCHMAFHKPSVPLLTHL